MDAFLQEEKKEKGNYKILLAATGVAVLIIAAIIGVWLLMPTAQDQQRQVLEGAFREGSPEFAELTKRIVVINDAQNTMEATTGLGTISMFIRGGIRNVSKDITFTVIEIKVSVLDPKDQVIKEKTLVIVPNQHPSLAPQETIAVNVPIEGFAQSDDRARVQWKVTAIKTQ